MTSRAAALNEPGPGAGVRPWTILVVEDDADLRDVLVSSLKLAGLLAVGAADGTSARTRRVEVGPDLVLLDVGLPDMSGFDLGRELRRDGDRVPIVYLTARDDLRDKLEAFDSGADDYITKPFSLAEVVARIRAVMARTAGADDGVLRYADLEVDESRHQVRRGGREVELTATEFRLLRHMVANAGHVMSRRQLLRHVWGDDFDRNTSVVENYVSFLRRKLDDPSGELLRTVRGVGYVVRAEEA